MNFFKSDCDDLNVLAIVLFGGSSPVRFLVRRFSKLFLGGLTNLLDCILACGLDTLIVNYYYYLIWGSYFRGVLRRRLNTFFDEDLFIFLGVLFACLTSN